MTKITYHILLLIAVFIVIIMPENVEASSKMPKGSTIATVPIEGKTDDEVRQLLDNEIAIWQAGEDLNITSEFEQFTIPRDAFEFDVNQTIHEFNERTKRTFSSLFTRQKNVHLPLYVHIKEYDETRNHLSELDYINDELVLDNVTETASELGEKDTDITYIEGKEIPLDTIAEMEMQMPNLSDAVLTHIIDHLHEFIIGPEESFSFLESIILPKHLTKSNEELNFVATALYSLFLQTNFNLVERYPAQNIQPYAEAGTEAVISAKENKDLIVINPDEKAYQMEAKKQGDKIVLSLKAAKSDLTYTYELENEKNIQQRTLYRYSKNLNAGEQQIIQEGSKGLQVEVHRSTYEKNVYIESELISLDVYVPVPRIILVSTSDDIPEEDLVGEEEEIENEVTELEEKIEELEEEINMTNPILDLFPVEEGGPTFTEQLSNMKQAQKELEEKIAQIGTDFQTSSITTEQEMRQFKEETERRLDEMNEQLEKLLDYILNDTTGQKGTRR